MVPPTLQSYIDNDAVIVLERYGHDLNIAQGGPVEIFVPGTGGTATVKNLVGIKFSKTDNPPVYSDIAVPSIEAGALINMNTSWFDNDGVQAKVGEPVTLEGASWGWTFGDAATTKWTKSSSPWITARTGLKSTLRTASIPISGPTSP